MDEAEAAAVVVVALAGIVVEVDSAVVRAAATLKRWHFDQPGGSICEIYQYHVLMWQLS